MVTFVPAANFYGIAVLSYTINDNEGGVSNVATITITVTAVNDAPIADNDIATTLEDTVVLVDLTLNDSDADGTIDTATVDLDPSTAAIDAVFATAQGNWSVDSMGIVTMTPITGFVGTAVISYTVNDNLGLTSNVATITIIFMPNPDCTIPTIWNGTTWSNGYPVANQPAVISGNFTSAGNLSACSLTVDSAAVVVVSSGDDFIISGAVTVATGASLTFSNNANLLQAGATNTNSGDIHSQRAATMRRLDYVYWSSPVANQNLKAFSPQTVSPPVGLSRFYEFDESSSTFVSLDPLTTNFATAKGYSLRAPNNFPTAGTLSTFNGEFSGIPNNGDITIGVTHIASGFNLIGNPYPSPIDATSFLSINPGTLYFWTHNSLSGTASNYASYNITGGVAAVSGGVIPNGTVQTGQGFVFYAATPSTVMFSNTMRDGNNSGQFFRNADSIERNRIWLNLDSNTEPLNQILIGYVSGATQGFDDSIDGKTAEQVSGISTVMNNENYAIQGRALPFATTDVVPMGFKAMTDDTYTISIDHVDGLFDTQNIYLKDNVTGAIHDLKISSYSFAATTGTDNTRFEIVYDNLLATQTPKFDTNSVVIFKQNNVLNINAGKVTMKAVKVFDIRGRLVFEQSNINATTTSLTNLKAEQQVLLVQITADDNSVVTKKVVY